MAGKKFLILGDSITNCGYYVSVLDFYFTRFLPEDKPEFVNIGVSSETVSGLSEAQHPFMRPCALSRAAKALRTTKPDVVIVCYGINDGIYQPFSQRNLDAFAEGYRRLISEIKSFGAQVVVLTPPVFDSASFQDTLLEDAADEEYSYMHPHRDYDRVMERYVEYVMTFLAKAADKVIDIYHPLKEDIARQRETNPAFLHGDGIHPGLEGHITIAREILGAFFSRNLPNLETWVKQDMDLFERVHARETLIHNYETELIGHDNPYKLEACPQLLYADRLRECEKKIQDYMMNYPEPAAIVEDWNGFQKHVWIFEGYEAIRVEPVNKRSDRAYVWRTEFFDAFAYVDLEMVRRGYGLVNLNLANQYGAEEATEVMGRFGTLLAKEHGYDSRCVLFGFSRGGLYAVSYALAWPERTAVIYLDAPVVDLSSWPGGYGKGIGYPAEWQECKDICGLKKEVPEQEAVLHMKEWSKDRVERLSCTGIPLIMVAGDCDEVVPYDENGALLIAAYRAKGGIFSEMIKPGVGHHPHSLTDPAPVADFIDRQFNDTASR